MIEEHNLFTEPIEEDSEITETATVTIRLKVNTQTYARVETIMREVAESLEWMAFGHDAILEAKWEQPA